MMYGPASPSLAENCWSWAESCLDHTDDANPARQMTMAKIRISTVALWGEEKRCEESSEAIVCHRVDRERDVHVPIARRISGN